jgi:Second Messenger Oligonucleotide or Dinucleotide Synthetase domain
MYTLGTHFDSLLSNIWPPRDRVEAARDLPPLVRAYLKEHKTFATVAPHSRLVGSYAQDMPAGDVKDVDFLVRVDGDPEANKPEAKKLIQDLRSALDGLPEDLGYEGWASVDIERARRSVHVYIKERDFHLDVVPCIAPDGFDKPLWVPDRGFNKWIPSHPVGYVQLLDDLNGQYGGKVKYLGRLIKHFRNYQMKQRKPKSYWLGALLVYHIRRKDGLDMSQPLAVIFRDLLDDIYTQYDHLLWTSESATPHIPDPMLGHDVSWNWSRTHFETFMRRVDEGRQWATRALESDDRDEAIGLWQKVFGEEFFPSEITEMASRLAAVGLPGRAVVNGTGLVTAIKPASGISTSTRPTTFHGQE